jgi:hypothetical protein
VVNEVRVASGPVEEAMTMKGTVCDGDVAKTAASDGMNTALSWCGPTVNCEMVPTAVPALVPGLRTTGTGLLRLSDPSLNCTAPAGACGATPAAVCVDTFAVSVTRAPWTAWETGDVVSVVVVAAGARAPVAGRALLGGAALAIPPTSNNVPTIATAIRKVLAAYP